MTSWIDADLPNDIKGAGLSDSGGPWLVIHIDALALDDIQLAQAIRGCEAAARYAQARGCADWISHNCQGHRPWTIPDEVLEYKAMLTPYGDDMLVRTALKIIADVEEYRTRKAAKQVNRREIQANYDHLFVMIGRRDGFRCAQCRGDDDLQIDHITALANGGLNDIDNLQLLCRTCNVRKGAR